MLIKRKKVEEREEAKNLPLVLNRQGGQPLKNRESFVSTVNIHKKIRLENFNLKLVCSS